MKPLKGLSAVLSLTMMLTSLTGMPTAFAADDTGAAAVQTAAAQKITFDDIYALSTSIRALRKLFEQNGRYETDGYKLLIQEYISGLLAQNKFPAVLLNAEKYAVSEAELAALKAENPDAEVITDQGYTWSADKVLEALGLPADRFYVKLKTVKTEDGGKTEACCECAAVPRMAEKQEEYVEQLTAALNCIQLQEGFAGFAYEDVLGKFYGTDKEFGDNYSMPALSGVDVIRHMTEDEIRKLFAARDLTAEKGYRYWSKEDVSEVLEDGKIPAVILYPEKYIVPQETVDALVAQYGSDPNTVLLMDDGKMWDIWALFTLSDASRYTIRWKTYKTEPDAYKPGYDCFCKAAIIPFPVHDYGTYTAQLADILNYVQLDTGFAGFYYENLDETFYGNSRLLDDGYLIPDWSPFDVISFMTTEEVEQAFRADGKSEERGNKVWTAADVLEMLDRGEFPSVIVRKGEYDVDEYFQARILEENPDAVFTEDQGVCWSHDRVYQFLDMPRDRYTLKMKTVIEDPGIPYAAVDIYCKLVMIPTGAENMDAYAKAAADALNIVQLRSCFEGFDTEKTDVDFGGSETAPENQYLLPVFKTELEKLPAARLAGDVNLDGSADVADAVLIARYAAEDPEAKLTDAGRVNADLDGDGNVTTDDLTALLRKIARISG